MKDWRRLPFTHGIEVEIHLVDKNTGECLEGNDLVNAWNSMFDGAANLMKNIRKDSKTPPTIRNKIKKVAVVEEVKREKKLKFVQVQYEISKKNVIKVDCFGPDPNISQITWLLEVVTPPCEFMEELVWWCDFLFEVAESSLPSTAALMPIGLNPTEESFRSGLTCGEHHHLGTFGDSRRKIAAYNMIRNFIPHLIALTTSSPMIGKKPQGKVIIKDVDGRTLILGKNCPRSLRLKNNTGQLGPNSTKYLPHLSPHSTKEDFYRYVNREPPDDRFVDVYPFTDYGTIEIRFWDSCFDPSIRYAAAAIVQALALKATRSLEPVPGVSPRVLFDNRERAVEMGLMGKFHPDLSLTEPFSRIYNSRPAAGQSRKLFEAVQSLLVFLKPELTELGFQEEVKPFIVASYGNSQFKPPLSPADYLLYQYEESQGNWKEILPRLLYGYSNTFEIDLSTAVLDILQSWDEQEVPVSTSPGIASRNKLTDSLRKDLTKKLMKAKPPKPVKRKPVAKKAVVKKRVAKKAVTKKVVAKKSAPRKRKKAAVQPVTVAKAETRPFKVAEKLPTAPPAVSVAEEPQITPQVTEVPSPTEGKIATVMRKRREELEKREREKKPFEPLPKLRLNLPKKVEADLLLPEIRLNWAEKDQLEGRLRDNPVIITVEATDSSHSETFQEKVKLDLFAVENGVTFINVPIETSKFRKKKEKLSLRFEARTESNEVLFDETRVISQTEKKPIPNISEFYIEEQVGNTRIRVTGTGRDKKRRRGRLRVILRSQRAIEELLTEEVFLEGGVSFQVEKSSFISPIYHSSPFIVTAIVGAGNNQTIHTEEILPIKREMVLWKAQNRTKGRDINDGWEPRQRYAFEPFVSFQTAIDRPILSFYVRTPDGKVSRKKREEVKEFVEKGTHFPMGEIKWKAPKNPSGNLVLFLEVETKRGRLDPKLITTPIEIKCLG